MFLRVACLTAALFLAQNAYGQLGGAFKKAGGAISGAAKKAGGDISNAGKKAGGDISNAGKKAGGDIARETKNGINQAGQLIEKPFRHAADNVKEGIFFQMRDHVAEKNSPLGLRIVRFSKGDPYYEAIQPLCPADFDFASVTFRFDAYVPSGMAGITFGDTVYIDCSYEYFNVDLLQLIAHETGHVLQYRSWGTKGFARKYMDDVFGGWTRYPNFDQVKIHDSLAIEQEADAFANRVMERHWQQRGQMQNAGRPNSNGNPGFMPDGSSSNGYPQGQVSSNPPQGLSQEQQIAGAIVQTFDVLARQAAERRAQQELSRQQAMRPANVPVVQPKLGLNGNQIFGRGYQVTFVQPGSSAARAGIEPGDIVVSVGGMGVDSASAISAALLQLAQQGARQTTVVVENSRLQNLPREQRLTGVTVNF